MKIKQTVLLLLLALLLTGAHWLHAQSNNALDFDGTDDYVQLPAAAYFTQNNFTIEAWVYPKSYNLWSRVIDFSNGEASDNVLMAVSDATSGKPAGSIFSDGEGTNFTAESTLELNTWSHLAIVVKGSNAFIYINGELDAASKNINEVANVERTLNYIGKSAWNDEYASMILDELKIWNSALTVSEIADNMYKKPVANPALLVYFDFDQGVQYGDNTAVASLVDKSGHGYHGTFNNLALTGKGSNFVAGVNISGEAVYTPVISTPTTITKGVSDAAFDLKATSTSPAPFTYTVEEGNAITLKGSTATITGLGTSVVRISQAAVSGFTEAYIDVTINVTTTPADLPATTFPQARGSDPSGIAHGDLNGDGFQDMAVAFGETNNVLVYINDGKGAFGIPLSYAAGSSPSGMVIADLDGDGDLDLATANYNSGTVSIFTNTGKGAFNTQVEYATDESPSNLTAGDLDGDGKPDLVMIHYYANTVSVLINTGTGAFNKPASYFTNTGPLSLAIGDLNGDGKPDLAIANYGSSTISTLTNKGNGTFNPRVEQWIGSICAGLALGDLDGNGGLDLITTNPNENKISVLMNTITDGFNERVTYPTGRYPWGVALGDLNGDGKLDLVTTDSQDNTVSVLINTGTGTFTDTFYDRVTYPVGTYPYDLTIGDWNADALLDVAVTNANSNNITILLNKGNGVLDDGTTVNFGYDYTSLAAGDLNGDSQDDLVIGTSGNQLLVRMNLGNNTYAPAVPYEVGAYPRGIVIADLNKDDKQDLATANRDDNTVSILINTGTGTFEPQATYEVGSNPQDIAAGDLDGDGKLDLVTANSDDNTVSILINEGKGTFKPQVAYEVGSQPRSIVIGELNREGLLDIATANAEDNTVSILINKGTGAFYPQETYEAGYGAQSLVIGDLNADGWADDLATANSYSNTVSVLINTGTGTFGTQETYTTGESPKSVALGDMNGDGREDLIVANEDEDNVSVFNNTGNGFETGISYSVSNGPTCIVVANLDNDRRPDLAGVTYDVVFTFLNATTVLEQTIMFDSLEDKTYGDPAFKIIAKASSGLSPTFTSNNPAVATVDGNTVTIVGAGRVTIKAAQAGGGKFYKPAPDVEQSFCVKPAKPVITTDLINATGPVLNSSATSGNQWYLNNEVIPDATDKTFTVSRAGVYTVVATADQCSSTPSDVINLVVTGLTYAETVSFHAYPNPATDLLTIDFSETGRKDLTITSIDGQIVHSSAADGQQLNVDVRAFRPGLYVLNVSTSKTSRHIKFIKK